MFEAFYYLISLTKDYETLSLLVLGGVGYFIKRNIENRKSKQILATAIISEIESIESRYNFVTRGGLKPEDIAEISPGEIKVYSLEITQDYFTVYHNNTSQIGLFSLNEVAIIIDFYTSAKGLVDSFLAWNDFLKFYNDFYFNTLKCIEPGNPSTPEMVARNKKINELFSTIPIQHSSLLEQQAITFTKAKAVKDSLRKYR